MTDGLIDILVERLNGLMPRVAIVLGSGLGRWWRKSATRSVCPMPIFQGFPPVAFPAMRENWSPVISVASP